MKTYHTENNLKSRTAVALIQYLAKNVLSLYKPLAVVVAAAVLGTWTFLVGAPLPPQRLMGIRVKEHEILRIVRRTVTARRSPYFNEVGNSPEEFHPKSATHSLT
jgi:hypothetical protein